MRKKAKAMITASRMACSSLRQARHPLELQDQAQGDHGLIYIAAHAAAIS
jgi:hypothetical protein